MKEITHVRPFAEGFIAHGLSDAGAEMKVLVREVRCSVIAPMESSLHFYFVMFGQLLELNPTGKAPLLFVSEFAGESQGEFFRKLGEDLNKMLCRVVYADFEGQKEFYLALHKRFSSANVSIKPAPFASDIPYGKTLIREWLKDKAIVIPRYRDTILRSELSHIGDESPEKESLAFHALRFVLGGFIQYPPVRRSYSPGRGRSRLREIV